MLEDSGGAPTFCCWACAVLVASKRPTISKACRIMALLPGMMLRFQQKPSGKELTIEPQSTCHVLVPDNSAITGPRRSRVDASTLALVSCVSDEGARNGVDKRGLAEIRRRTIGRRANTARARG